MAQVALQDGVADLVVHIAFFDHGGQQGGSEGGDLQVGLERSKLAFVHARLHGGLGGDDAHFPVALAGYFFYERIDYVDEEGLSFEEVYQHVVCCGGGRVAGHHDHLALLFEQEFGDAQAVVADGVGRFVAVGQVGGIAEIDDFLFRQKLNDGIGDSKSANARVKNTDGAVGRYTIHLLNFSTILQQCRLLL